MALLITTSGETKEVTPKNKKEGFTCEELYELIGNGCEMVEVALRYIDENDKKERMVIGDEEGSYPGVGGGTKQPFNWKISSELIAKYHQPIYILGNVVICNNKEFQ